MNRSVHFATIIIAIVFFSGCSGGEPTTPDPLTGANDTSVSRTRNIALWGYYDVRLDLENMTAEVIPYRDAMFAVNATLFLNLNPATLQFTLNSAAPTAEYVDVDIDVSITHPLPGNEKFHGYDVRGLMIGNGSGQMKSDPDVTYAVKGVDQYLLNADGYTRWFNRPEFYIEGLFGYKPGTYATRNFNGNATINGYKYYADGLMARDNAFEFLEENPGIFQSGSTNTRNYQIRFPIPSPGIQFGYAILADWSGGPPQHHPSPAPETVVWSVTIDEELYYTPTTSGGDLSFAMGLFSFGEPAPSTCVVEADVLSSPQVFDFSTHEPGNGGDYWLEWRMEFPADNVTSTIGNEMLVALEFDGHSYNNPFGVTNDAMGDPLGAYFRIDIPVLDEIPPNYPPVIRDGVSGADEVEPDGWGIYFVMAYDPEEDPIDFWWTITDTSDMSIVLEGPGDNNGSLMFWWDDEIGPESGDVYDIDCEVSDSRNPPVSADTLTVTIT